MGITSTIVRATIQELADEEHRAQILSILLLSFVVSSPISSILLGILIANSSPLTALLPGIGISLLIFIFGYRYTTLWHYESANVS